MNILRFIIHRKTFVGMLFIGLTLLGYVSYKQLPVELMPNAELPYLMVTISSSQEMDPESIEKQAVILVEGAIGTLEGIDMIETSIDRRRTSIRISFNPGVEVKYAHLKLQQKMDELRSELPEEFTVSVQKVDTENLSNEFMMLQIRGSGDAQRIRKITDEDIAPKLTNIDGIANVNIVGGNTQAIQITLDNDACEELNITPSTIMSLINQNNEVKTYIGQAYDKNRSYYVNLVAEYTDIRKLEEIVVSTDGPLLLKDIATVQFGESETETISRVNGMEAISVQLIRDTQSNLIELSHTAQDVIAELNRDLQSQDIELVIQTNSADDIEENINLIIKLAILGGVLAVIILWFFLNNIKLAIIMMLAIPISVFTAFNFFYAYNISVNSLTLVGIALAVGMLLNNSVVVLENIYRLASNGMDPDTAAIQGTSEVWRAVFASTLTTITVFIPFLFASDYSIRLVGNHIGISIISTLIISLVVALMLIPMVTHYLLKRGSDKGFYFNKISQRNRLMQIYNVLLKSAIRFPAATIIGAVILFFVSLLLCISLSMDVSSEIDLTEFDMYVTMRTGSTLDMTDGVVTELEEMVSDIEEIQDVVSNISAEEATITIIMKEDYEKIADRTIAQVKNEIEDRVDDFRAADVSLTEPTASSSYGGGMANNPMANVERMMGIGSSQETIILKGSDFDMLRNVADDIKYNIDNLESLSRESRLSVPSNRPEIHLMFDNRLMSAFDIPMSAISSELSTFQPQFSAGASYKQGNDEYDIVISMKEEEEEKIFDDLKALPIRDRAGNVHDLEDVSRIIYSYGKSGINRINQEKQIELTFSFQDEINGSKALLEISRDEIDQVVASIVIPPGIAVEVEHDVSDISEFYFLIGAAFVLIYMLLAAVFESFSIPIVMMFTIPLAAIGAFWALIFTGNSIFNANSLIGLLIMLGVVVNNGIILIDYTRILQKRGFNRARALLTAGQARIRPILITATTTIVAMAPLAMGNTERISRIGAPFAITVIGGLTLSTLFTLIFIPTVYSGLEAAIEWFRKLSLKLKLLQFALLILGCFFIYYYIESLLWQFAYFFVFLLLIPGGVYFLMVNLRRAQSDFIRTDDILVIKLRRIVKIYDNFSRFSREWKKGERLDALYGTAKTYVTWSDFSNYRWQIPLLGFLIYFAYFYLKNNFWIFVVAHIVFFYLFMLVNPLRMFFTHRAKLAGKSVSRFDNLLYRLTFWGFPISNLFIFYIKDFRTEVLVFISLFWLMCMIVYTTSNRLHRKNINIMRLTGRFAGLRQKFYSFALQIPIIGKKKNPFNALDGVSLEIENGMFGLLGPNGAGKSTIMRIICAILNQGMGTIKINGIDYRDKREELQGLIGYLPQDFGTYENMTAYEYLDYLALLKNMYDKDERAKRINYVLTSVHLDENKNQKIGSFSGGMKQRVGIALTLLHLPRILVVDEPTAGLDPRERIRFRNLLVELSRDRIVIFSTHIIEDIASSCNMVAVLNRGKLYYNGQPKNMVKTANNKVWQFTLPESEFEKNRNEMRIVHHMQFEGQIRVRALSESPPYPGAINVIPTLEDAYLWLLG